MRPRCCGRATFASSLRASRDSVLHCADSAGTFFWMNDLAQATPSGVHDFDFLVGDWNVEHKRLEYRLANCETWISFSGTCRAFALMGGSSNVDDNVLHLPNDSYKAVTLRVFDPRQGLWSIWWIDGRANQLDTPVRGVFEGGVGTFFADDTFEGRKIRVRFLWCDITADSARWEQAFSIDGGSTWETNWTMKFSRVGPISPISRSA